MKVILTSLLAVFTVSGALAQQLTVTIPGGHDREWYEHHGYFWRDGHWYRGEDRERHEYREHHHQWLLERRPLLSLRGRRPGLEFY
jgi:hypothetical protein